MLEDDELDWKFVSRTECQLPLAPSMGWFVDAIANNQIGIERSRIGAVDNSPSPPFGVNEFR